MNPRLSIPPRRLLRRSPTAGGMRRIKPEIADIPPVADGDVRIIPLGGVEEIGKNMTAIEIAGEILIIDIGFEFPDEQAPGVDYIIPDTAYLEKNQQRIKGVIITHGHLDHTGGIPYVMPKIGNPPLYTRNLTALMIKKRQEEFPHLPALNIIVVEKNSRARIGNFNVRFFGVTHTIPDSMGVIVETPFGNIINPGDFKLDLDQINGKPTTEEEDTYRIFEQEKNLLLMADSTNIENPGFSPPESEVHKNLENIITGVKGRLIIGMFASQFQRIIKVIQIVEKLGRKIIVEGRSMKTNIEVAELAGMFTAQKGTIIPIQEVDSYPPEKVVVLATGAQGEEFAALMRMATKQHKYFHFRKGDTVLLSASIVPGNERTVQKLKDNIARQGAKIIHYRTSEVYIHSSGHGNRGEIEWLHKKIQPRFFVPIHGYHQKLRVHADLAMDMGMPEKNIIVPDNGMVIEITDNGQKIRSLKESAVNRVVMVDGLGNNDIKDVVIKDRVLLAQEGMFVIIAIVNIKNGRVIKSPDIISRGFIYLKESQDLLHHVRVLTKRKIEEVTSKMHPINFDYVKNTIREEIGRYLFQKTHSRPIILPVLIEV